MNVADIQLLKTGLSENQDQHSQSTSQIGTFAIII
jgi:hypothetical protein